MAKGENLQRVWDQLPEERKRRITERADLLEAGYLKLQELRKSAGIRQAKASDSRES